MVVAFVFISSSVLLWPIDRTETATLKVDYSTTIEKSSNYELGETVTTQAGKSGERLATYSVRTNLIGMIFASSGSKEEVASKTITAPVKEIVTQGTKRYQYMLCSDGSYRYFNDDQFKDPNTGFTSKSEDHCAKNGNGAKVSLVDNMGGGVRQIASPSPNINHPPLSSGCERTNIVKYKTEYRDDPYLAKGVQETAVRGYDGYTHTCPSSGYRNVVAPMDAIVNVGTGEDAERRAEANRIAEEQRRRTEINARNDRIAQCIRNMRARIPQGGSALEYAISQCYSTP